MPHPDGAGLPRSTDPRLSADIKRISRWRKTQDRNRLPCSTKHTPPWPRVRRYGTEPLQNALSDSVPHFCGTEHQKPHQKGSVPYPQANSATENGGIPTTLTLKPRCGTVRNHFKGLYSIPYIPVVRNANKTVQKLPYHDTVVCKHQQPNQKVPYHTRAAMVIRSCK